MLEGRIAGNEGWEESVSVEVKEEELIVYDGWVCEWGERIEG